MRSILRISVLLLFSMISCSGLMAQGEVINAVEFSNRIMNDDKRGIVKTEDGSYLMYMRIPDAGVTIDGQFIEKLDNPPEIPVSTFNNDMVIFKLSADMELLAWEQVLNFSNNFEITGSNDKVFIKHNNTHNEEPFILIGDELIEFAPGQTTVFMLDDQLNFEGELFSVNNLITNFVADESFLYAMAIMNAQEDTLVALEQDTLYNFKKIFNFQGEELLIYVNRAEAIIKYDYNELALDTMWRIGSTQGETSSYKLKIDNAGNLVMIGQTGSNFIHNDIDTIHILAEESARGYFWAKFNPSSELEIIDFQEQIELQFYHDVYLTAAYGGDSLVIGDQVFYNYLNPELDFSQSRSVLIKFDGSNGEIQWAYSLEGFYQFNGIHYVSIKEGVCSLVDVVKDDYHFDLQGNTYYNINGNRANYIANLNADDGSEISHFVHIAEGFHIFWYIENTENSGIKRLHAEFTSAGEFLGIAVGSTNQAFFLEIDFDFFTSIKEAQNTDDLLKTYPNPKGSDDQLHVQLSKDYKVEWALYSTTGKLLQVGNPIDTTDLFSIDLSAYAAGIYVFQVRSAGLIQNQLIIKP